jgi:hypothetical protein
LLQTHPFTAQLKFQHTINYHAAYSWKENPTDPEIAFKGLIDIWTPLISDDNYSFYEPYFFTERGMDPKEEEIWSYTVSTAHLNIDTLGLNNRCMPMKNYFFDMNGFLVWASIIYEMGTSTVNPRINPYFSYGNGAITFFYPPGDTVTPSPDFTITPSARLEMFREGVEDHEYMVILDDAVAAAAAAGIDTSTAASLKAEMQRMFIHPQRWSVNDEFYLLMRKRIMEEIDALQWYTTYGVPEVDTTDLRNVNNEIFVDVYASHLYRYNLLRTNELTYTPQWQIVDTALVETSDTITLTDDSYGTAPRVFYRVEAVIP